MRGAETVPEAGPMPRYNPAAAGDVLVMPCDPAGKVVAVSLFGRHGEGRMMTLDVDGWERALEITPRWIAMKVDGRLYVAHGARSSRSLAGQRADSPVLLLSRFLTSAGPEEAVWFRDGNSLRLTAVNMEVVTRMEQRRRSGAASQEAWRARKVGRGEGVVGVH